MILFERCFFVGLFYLFYIFYNSSVEPWLHVGYFFVGCWAGNAYVRYEKKLVLEINEIRADKGMPPIVGSGHWIRYDVEK